MKQLKFMLAAATAIGLATAAQADAQFEKKPISSENFDGVDAAGKAIYSVGDNPAAIANSGFTFEGDDNESTIVIPDGEEDKALKVNTGTDPLLRKIDPVTGNAVALDVTKKVYIDTKVQFTVTPFADKDNVTATAGDKLMIYLLEVPEVKAEDGTVTTPASTKLMVKAAGPVAGDEELIAAKDYEVSNTVVPNEWYDLKVVANTFVVDQAFYPYFRITITDKNGEEQTLTRNDQESFAEFDELDDAFECFPSLALVGNVGSGVGSATLDFVGFAGEGVVDDLVFSKDVEQETSVDFTFAITRGDGVSAVAWTIDGVAQESLSATVTAGQTIAITDVTYADWYVASGTYVKDWSTEASEDLTAITVEAKPTANVTTDAEGNVKIEVTENTKPADVGIKTGSFAAADTEPAELNKALTWATAKGGAAASAAGALVGQLDFTDETETSAEQAYLLNCAPTEDAIKEKKDAFVFSAVTFDENGAPVVTVDPEFAGDVNGRIEIRGATSLDAEDAFTAPKKDGDAFFKAFLVK